MSVYGRVAQSAEATDIVLLDTSPVQDWGTIPLKSVQCGFESHLVYLFADVVQLVERLPSKQDYRGSESRLVLHFSAAHAANI